MKRREKPSRHVLQVMRLDGFSRRFILYYNVITVILHLLTVRDFLGLLTPLSTDYVTRPFFPPPQRKTGKSGLATRDYSIAINSIFSEIFSVPGEYTIFNFRFKMYGCIVITFDSLNSSNCWYSYKMGSTDMNSV